jgi:hypothetical protein
MPETLTENSPPLKKGRVRIPYAEKDGRLVHVSTVERGLKCGAICPVCKTDVVARKGKKIRHHFSHYPGANCNAETALHVIARHLIQSRLENALTVGQSMTITWKCIACRDRHNYNLLNNVDSIAIEKVIGNCRPDIALLDKTNKPVAFLEIVVSHRPERRVIRYCNQRSIPLLIFRIKDAESLESLQLYQNLSPTTVLFCLRNRCERCGAPLFAKRLFIIESNCWRCGAPIKLALVEINRKIYGANYLSENDRQIARSRGIILRDQFNHHSNKPEIANACPNCGIITSNRYVAFQKKAISKLPGINRGFTCLNCLHSTE